MTGFKLWRNNKAKTRKKAKCPKERGIYMKEDLSIYQETVKIFFSQIKSIRKFLVNNLWGELNANYQKSVNDNLEQLENRILAAFRSDPVQNSLGEHTAVIGNAPQTAINYKEILNKLGLENELFSIKTILETACSIQISLPLLNDKANLQAISQGYRERLRAVKDDIENLFIHAESESGKNTVQLKIEAFFNMLFFIAKLNEQSNAFHNLIIYIKNSSSENLQNLALFLFSDIDTDVYYALLLNEGIDNNRDDTQVLETFKTIASKYQPKEAVSNLSTPKEETLRINTNSSSSAHAFFSEPKKIQHETIEKNPSNSTVGSTPKASEILNDLYVGIDVGNTYIENADDEQYTYNVEQNNDMNMDMDEYPEDEAQESSSEDEDDFTYPDYEDEKDMDTVEMSEESDNTKNPAKKVSSENQEDVKMMDSFEEKTNEMSNMNLNSSALKDETKPSPNIPSTIKLEINGISVEVRRGVKTPIPITDLKAAFFNNFDLLSNATKKWSCMSVLEKYDRLMYPNDNEDILIEIDKKSYVDSEFFHLNDNTDKPISVSILPSDFFIAKIASCLPDGEVIPNNSTSSSALSTNVSQPPAMLKDLEPITILDIYKLSKFSGSNVLIIKDAEHGFCAYAYGEEFARTMALTAYQNGVPFCYSKKEGLSKGIIINLELLIPENLKNFKNEFEDAFITMLIQRTDLEPEPGKTIAEPTGGLTYVKFDTTIQKRESYFAKKFMEVVNEYFPFTNFSHLASTVTTTTTTTTTTAAATTTTHRQSY